MEVLLIDYRWVLVIFFLLPLSVLHDAFSYARNKIIFKLNSAPKKHDEKVRKVQKQVRDWNKTDRGVQMCTARPGWQTMSFRRGIYKKTMFNVDVNLMDVLDVDEERRTVRLEPMATMGQVSAVLSPLGWTLPVLPEIDDLTVGGLVMGTGIESSSHIYGLFQHICVSYELVMSDGSVVKCSENENSDLFYAVPWSYGTLGFLTCVEVKLVPAKPYIQLKYCPYYSQEDTIAAFDSASKDCKNEFVECLMFDKNRGVVMTGVFKDFVEGVKFNAIGRWYKPWFFEHVRQFLTKGAGEELIPLRDYYHRHTRSIFWELKDIIPFGNFWAFRWILGWAVPPKVSFLKLTQTETVKKLYEENHIIQDMLIPIEELANAVNLFDETVRVYPLWLCPFKLPANPGMVHSPTKGDSMFVDVGVYGVPSVSNFNPITTTRLIEEFVRKVRGYQMLYADTYMTEQEFREMFDHNLYDRMRKKHDCEKAFPTVYGKVNKSVRTYLICYLIEPFLLGFGFMVFRQCAKIVSFQRTRIPSP